MNLIAYEAGDKLNTFYMDRWLVFVGLAALGVLAAATLLGVALDRRRQIRRRLLASMPSERDKAQK